MKFNWRKKWPKVLLVILLVALGACLVRVLVWEYFYYLDKEGSERAAVISSPDAEENLDETELSGTEIDNYTVAPDRPRFLSIERLGIKNARVIPVGLSSSRQVQTPNNIFDIGWYTGSGLPGSGKALVMDGHNGGPTKAGVFKYLPELTAGDLITIERGDGKIFTYSIVENVAYPLDQANANMGSTITPLDGQETLTLITCSGEWSDVQRTYLSRQFVRAVLVDE